MNFSFLSFFHVRFNLNLITPQELRNAKLSDATNEVTSSQQSSAANDEDVISPELVSNLFIHIIYIHCVGEYCDRQLAAGTEL